jgi:hypothetical protein
MREPKFSDAPCYGKEFDAQSKICRVCLANRSCQRLFLKTLGVAKSGEISALQNFAARKPQAFKKAALSPRNVPTLASSALLRTALPAQSAVFTPTGPPRCCMKL